MDLALFGNDVFQTVPAKIRISVQALNSLAGFIREWCVSLWTFHQKRVIGLVFFLASAVVSGLVYDAFNVTTLQAGYCPAIDKMRGTCPAEAPEDALPTNKEDWDLPYPSWEGGDPGKFLEDAPPEPRVWPLRTL